MLHRLLFISCIFKFTTVVAAAAASLLDGFAETVVVSGINAATTLTILPDGRVIYAEQTGFLRVVAGEELLVEPALDISDRLDTYWERGLVGLTHDRDFPRSPYLYLVYVAKEPYTHHVISRFTLEGNRVDPQSERILLLGDNQAKLGGHKPAGHQGGPIRHGPDGKLYIGLGENTHGSQSQSIASLCGKILRINTDGSIPEDNPFYRQTYGKYRAIHALGIRNPYGLDFQPVTGRLFEADVGQSSFEEINEIKWGHNYGWPHAEGFSAMGGYANPLYAYPPTTGRSICGGIFYPDTGNYPEEWRGKFFFLDWAANWVKALDVDQPDLVLDFAKDLDSPVWVEAHPDGSLWILNRGTIWRDGNRFKENAGSLVRFHYLGEGKGTTPKMVFPATLSETQLFQDLINLKPAKGMIEFSMNAPVWNPGVTLRNWMQIPGGKKIQFSEHDEWVFPEGAVLVRHFDTLQGHRHETHVYWALGDGKFRAAAYRWNASQQEAGLVENSEISPISGKDSPQWFSPGPERRLDPQLALIGFIPQFNTRQLNVGNQLGDWGNLGLLSVELKSKQLIGLPRLASLEDDTASVELKVRSYLDANCAACHQPGGPSRGNFDARFSTPLSKQDIIFGELMAGNLDIDGAKVVVPRNPEKSILLERLKRDDFFRMPPVSVHGRSSPAIPLVEEWIRSMDTVKGDDS